MNNRHFELTLRNLKQCLKKIGVATVMLATATMSVFAYDGNTRFGCYAYVHDGCQESPPCTDEEYNFLLDSCDEYPSKTEVVRPTFKAKPQAESVAKSTAHKKKFKKLKADIRRK